MRINHTERKARSRSVIAGIEKHITAPIVLGGVTYTPAELQAEFQALVDALEGNDALRKALSDSMAQAHAVGATADAVYELLRMAVMARYGRSANALLNDFGMSAPKDGGAKTNEAKVAAVAKRAATRAARHTMGAVRKKGVTGEVVGVVVTPVVALQSAEAIVPDVTPVGGAAGTGVGW